MIGLVLACVVLGLYAWQDGVHPCFDGVRYTSGILQPYPFHRRFCHWPKALLQVVTYACLVGVAVSFGSWQKALIFITLPGCWFLATHPTTVDAPSMGLAWFSSVLFPAHPFLAVLVSGLSGFIHERGPVFAAVYSASPWPLLGMVATGWWKTPAPQDHDQLVGVGTWGAIKAHRPYQDWLDYKIVGWSMRGVLPAAVFYGASPRDWMAFLVAMATRALGSDTSRFLLWAAPPMIADAGEWPMWMLALHSASFRRVL